MPLKESKLTINDFSKGLHSDFTELATPQGVSVDEDNVRILRTGARRRRLGMKIEDSGTFTGALTPDDASTLWFQDYLWSPVASIGDKVFIVLQVGATLYFYDAGSATLSASQKSFTVNLDTYKAPTAATASKSPISVATVRGAFFVVGEAISPFYITYDPDTDTITVNPITIQIRDFDQQDFTFAIDAETAVADATPELKYDLLNQGWNNQNGLNYYESSNYTTYNVTNTDNAYPLNAYVAGEGKYPPRNGPWFLGRQQQPDTGGTSRIYQTFSWHNFIVSSKGNTIAPFGHFIYDAFNIDRSTASGISGLASEIENDRPTAVASMAGRTFYGLKNKIYFSQVIQNDLQVCGRAYQEGDPTTEDAADLIDSDGGVVKIHDLGRIIHFFVTRTALVVFADNGVWTISGAGGDQFKATSYSVSKISSVGIFSGRSVVDTEGTPIWWGTNAIYTLKPSEIQQSLYEVDNLIDRRLMEYYNDIPTLCKQYAKGSYDPIGKTVSWLFRSAVDETDSSKNLFVYDKQLNYNLIFDAFHPYSFDTTIGPYVSGIMNAGAIFQSSENVDVVDNSGNLVIDGSGNQVVAEQSFLSEIDDTVKYWVFFPVPGGSVTYQWSFGLLNNYDFSDFEEFIEGGIDYDSYLHTFYHILDDAMTNIQTPYVWVYLRNTQNGPADVSPPPPPPPPIVSSAETNPTLVDNNVPATPAEHLNWGPDTAPWTAVPYSSESGFIFSSAESPVDDSEAAYIRFYGFSNAIPGGATITGVKVNFHVRPGNSNVHTLSDLRLAWGASASSTSNNLADSAFLNPDTDYEYGAADNLWGASLNNTIINSSDFGLILKCNRASGIFSRSSVISGGLDPTIDWVKITVYYIA